MIVVSELIPALYDEGIHCEIATTRGYRVGADITGPEGVPTHVFDTGPAARLWTAYSRDLARFLDDSITQFDLIHIHEIWHYAGYAAFRAAKKRNVYPAYSHCTWGVERMEPPTQGLEEVHIQESHTGRRY